MTEYRKRSPAAIDAHIGSRLRLRRILLGMSQEALGQMIGLTFQQVQKYERGANRVGAGLLYILAQKLSVPVGFFYDQLDGDGDVEAVPNIELNREDLELIRNYQRITDPAIRAQVRQVLATVARHVDPEGEPSIRRGRPPKENS